jgi:hypothetical protein
MGVDALPLVGDVVYPASSVVVIYVLQGRLGMNIASSLHALHWPCAGPFSPFVRFEHPITPFVYLAIGPP